MSGVPKCTNSTAHCFSTQSQFSRAFRAKKRSRGSDFSSLNTHGYWTLPPIKAIDRLAQKYQQAGKRLRLRHLSPDCSELLQKAKSMVEINLFDDPPYHVADDQLS
jgi:hypothetical protein